MAKLFCGANGLHGAAAMVAAAMAAGVCWGAPVWAQQDPSADSMASGQEGGARALAADESGDQTIIVTARRRQERITDVPAAVDVVGQELIADRGGFFTLQDLANNVPSVNFAATSTPTTAEISMRGSGTARSTNAEGGVGLYRNGTYVGGGRRGGRTFTRMDFFDLDRMEVLRGVQGALYGRNAIGGSLNLMNIQPQFRNEGWFRGGFGSFLRAEAQGAVNLVVSDRLAIRIGGDLLEQGEGAFFNPFRRDYFDEQRALGLRGQVRFRTDRFDATLMLETSRAKLPPLVFALAIAPSPAFPQGVTQDPENVPWNGRSVADQRQDSAILNMKIDLGFADFAAVGSLRSRDTDHGFDGDGLDPDALALLRAGGGGLTVDAFQEVLQLDRTDNGYVQFNLNDKGQSPFKWLLGFEHIAILSDSRFSNTRTRTRANPSPGSVQITALDTWADAAFGSIGYDFGDRISVSGELRYTRERKEIVSDRVDLATGISQGPRFQINTGIVDRNLSYTLSISHRLPAIDGLVYLRHGTGFRAGGFNDDLGDPRQPNPVIPQFDNENASAWEIGFKGRVLGPLNLNLAVYQTDTADNLIQDANGCFVNFPACPVAQTIFLRNGGDNRVRGAEAQVDGRVKLGAGQFRLTASAAYMDATIVSGADAGRRIPQVPDWVFNAGGTFTHPLGERLLGFANFQYNSRFGGVQEIIQTPALVDFYNLDVRFGTRANGLEIAAFANNVTDKRYVIFSTPTAIRINQPRVLGVQMTKTF